MIPFDIVVLVILLASAGLGFVQGAVRELVSLVSLVLAVAAAILAGRHLQPFIAARIDLDWAAGPASFLLVFFAVYLALRLVGGGLSGGIRQARLLNALDRSLGFGFGLIRAMVFLGVCNLLFNAATPPSHRPDWLETSLFYPLTERSATLIRTLAPKGLDLADRWAPRVGDAVENALGDRREGDTGPGRGYENATPHDRDKAAETPW